MSNQTLALKYRPRLFSELRGQPDATSLLASSLRAGRTANAYLLAGPRGAGKTSAARILARALNCLEATKPVPEPCNRCRSCLEILEGRSLDLVEIDGASNRGIEDVRNIRESCRFSPSTSRFRVYLIDEVHMLTDHAFNALLKTLEEPPPHVKFIFATTHPGKLLPTVLSRCERYEFHPAPVRVLSEHLGEIAAREKIRVEPEALNRISQAAAGSFRDALSLLDQASSLGGDSCLGIAEVEKMLGLVPETVYLSMLEAFLAGDRRESLRILAKANQSGAEMVNFFSGLLEFARHLVLITHDLAGMVKETVTGETLERLETLGGKITPAEAIALFESISREKNLVRREDLAFIQAELSCLSIIAGRAPETGQKAALKPVLEEPRAAACGGADPAPPAPSAGTPEPTVTAAPKESTAEPGPAPEPGATAETAPREKAGKKPAGTGVAPESVEVKTGREFRPEDWRSFTDRPGNDLSNLRPCLLGTCLLSSEKTAEGYRLELSAANSFCLETLKKKQDLLAGRWVEIHGYPVKLSFTKIRKQKPHGAEAARPESPSRPLEKPAGAPVEPPGDTGKKPSKPAGVILGPEEEKKVALVTDLFSGEKVPVK